MHNFTRGTDARQTFLVFHFGARATALILLPHEVKFVRDGVNGDSQLVVLVTASLPVSHFTKTGYL